MRKSKIQITPETEAAVFARAQAGADALMTHGILGSLINGTKEKLGSDIRLEAPCVSAFDPRDGHRKWSDIRMDITLPSPRAMRPHARKVVGQFVVARTLTGEGMEISLLRGARRPRPVYIASGPGLNSLATKHAEALVQGRLRFMANRL